MLDRTPPIRPKPKPTWQCEYCGRFYSERTAMAHGFCQQQADRRDAEQMWPDAR